MLIETKKWPELKNDDLLLLEKAQKSDLEYAEIEIQNLRVALHKLILENDELVAKNADLQMPSFLQEKFESEVGKFGDFSFEKTDDGQYQTSFLQSLYTHWLVRQHEIKYSHEFKNFHRLLCERFGYVHDEKFWWHDQLSLIEFLAAKRTREDGVKAE